MKKAKSPGFDLLRCRVAAVDDRISELYGQSHGYRTQPTANFARVEVTLSAKETRLTKRQLKALYQRGQLS